jgi:hypothetical protein
MISVHQETLIPLRDAPKHLPVRPNGKRLHISAVYRWIAKGVAGVVLEAVRIGGTTYTSLEALQRFAERMTGRAEASPMPATASTRATMRRQEGIAVRLERELGMQAGSLARGEEY